MLKIAIVDDDEVDIKRLKGFLFLYFSNKKENNALINTFSRGLNFLEDYKEDYDAIFLDIDMPLMDGMQCAYKIREKNKHVAIIFVTNYSSLAIDGYGVNALDFLVKPVKENDVYRISEKILAKVKDESQNKKIFVKVKSGYQSIRVDEIKYIEVDLHDIIYYCKDGVYKSRGVLKNIEKELDPKTFVKCSSCYLVNLNFIDSIQKDDVKVGDVFLRISRKKKKDFLDAFTRKFN